MVSYAEVIHSVDRLRLVRARARGPGPRAARDLLGPGQPGRDPARGGAFGPEVMAVADAIASEDALILGGVMAVAPMEVPAAAAFRKLKEVADEVRGSHPGAVMISAGMSDDLEQAIEAAQHTCVSVRRCSEAGASSSGNVRRVALGVHRCCEKACMTEDSRWPAQCARWRSISAW